MMSRTWLGSRSRHAAAVGLVGALGAATQAQVVPAGGDARFDEGFNLSPSAHYVFSPLLPADGERPFDPRGGGDGTDGCVPGSPITGASGTSPATTVGATNTAADSAGACGASAINADVWFTYTAVGCGVVTFSFCPAQGGASANDTVLEAYSDCQSTGGFRIICNDDFCGLQSSIDVPVASGATYKIRVSGFSTAIVSGTLGWTTVAAPTPGGNDACASGTAITGNGVVFTGNAGATNTPADSLGACGADATNVDRWFTYTAPATGSAVFKFCAVGGCAPYDTVLSAYAACGAAAPIACNDDTCGLQSQITVAVTAATTYKIRVSGFATDTGTGVLMWSSPSGVPPNNDCAAATAIDGSGSIGFTTVGATNDGTASCGLSANTPDVWFQYVSGVTGSVVFDTCTGTTYDTVLSAHTACGGVEIGCNDDGPCGASGLQSRLTVGVTAHRPILIRVSGFNGQTGAGTLTYTIQNCVWDCPSGSIPENEDCGGNNNGGCNPPGPPPIYQNLTCNSNVCASTWADANMRDTDWYSFSTTAAATTVTLRVTTNSVPLVMFLLNNSCPPTLIGSAAVPAICGSVATITSSVGPGTYVAFVAPGTLGGGIFNGFPCPPFSCPPNPSNCYLLCVDFGHPCPGGVVITDFAPNEAGFGDLVMIHGTGFGNNPDDLCVTAMLPTGMLVPFTEVLQVTDDQIVARMGPVPPDAGPALIKVMTGIGHRGPFTPAFRDIIVEDPQATWALAGDGTAPAMAAEPIFLIPTPDTPMMQNIYSTIVNGQFCMFIDRAWPVNKCLEINGRLHGRTQCGTFGTNDIHSKVRFRWGGTAQQCANRICDVIRCVLVQQGGLPAGSVNCTVTQVGPNVWKITVGIAGRCITGGTLHAKISMPGMGTLTPPGLPVTAFGNALIDAAPIGLLISNIGSSGQDGVSIDLGRTNTRGLLVAFDPMDFDVPDRMLNLDAWGFWNGQDCHHLGHGGLWGRPNSCENVSADFSDIGSPTVRVDVFNGTQMVGSVLLPNGMLGVVQGMPGQRVPLVDHCGKLPPFPPPNPPCFIINYAGPFIYTPLNGQPMPPGNSLRLLAANPAAPIDLIGLLDVGASNPDAAPSFTMHMLGAEFLGQPPCPCDFNHDGSLNSQDFFDFLNCFFTPGCTAADFNNSGAVNSQDFFDFLNCFFAGCP